MDLRYLFGEFVMVLGFVRVRLIVALEGFWSMRGVYVVVV